MEFIMDWLWLIFIIFGVLLAVIELIFGVDTSLDLVFIGSTFVIGGIVSWLTRSWLVAPIVTGVTCIAYLAIGRRYVHRWTAIPKEKTNIDTIIGLSGTVIQPIEKNSFGIVKVRNEEWRAVADDNIDAGEEIVVRSVSGVTLTVEKRWR